MENSIRILLVGDNAAQDSTVEQYLLAAYGQNLALDRVGDLEQARAVIAAQTFDIFLFDQLFSATQLYREKIQTGLDLARWAHTHGGCPPVILLSNSNDYATDVAVMEYGVSDFLVKDQLDSVKLERAIRYALRRYRYEQKLLQLAYRDPLTKLHNTISLKRVLQKLLQDSRRNSGYFAVISLDLDHFKQVNQALGYQMGDDFLKVSANILSTCCGPSDIIARKDGDEFTIIASNLYDRRAVSDLASRIIDSFAKGVEINTHSIVISLSIGIAVFPSDSSDATELLHFRNHALSQARLMDGNSCCFYDLQENKKIREQVLLQNEIAVGISKQEFELYYQPIVEINTGYPMYVEALMRWNHPQKGLVSPDVFIPLMELTSQIVTMGEWSIEAAARQYTEWIQQGLPPIPIAVNISAVQFVSGTLVETINRVIKDYELNASFLILEITESSMMDADKAMQVITQLHSAGIKISVDDFGTGYSSLTYLKRFDINILKIDKEFVGNLTKDREDDAITGAIIALGRSLQLSLVAEGVETQTQRDFLINHKCHFAQGYLFGRPMRADDFVSWYKQHRLMRGNQKAIKS